MKKSLYILIIVFLASTANCNQNHFELVTKVVIVFSALDVKWRELRQSPNPNTLYQFKVALTASSILFKTMSKEANPKLKMALEDYSNICDDTIAAIDRFEKTDKEMSLGELSFILQWLSHITQGTAVGLLDKTQKDIFLISKEEVAQIHKLIASKFGTKIAGPKAINGDTPFALSMSLLNRFLDYNNFKKIP